MAPTIEKIIDSIDIGEGPHWDEETQQLYFINVIEKTIHKYDPATKKHSKAALNRTVSFVIPVDGEKDKFLVSQERDLIVVDWDGESNTVTEVRKIAEVDNHPNLLTNRLNDGKCDPSGRLWTGSMGQQLDYGHFDVNKGTIFSLEKGQIKSHVSSISISNGLAFNPSLNKMYYIDSLQQTVDQFDIDIKAGTISNREVIFTLLKHNISGLPDGMTIDTDGNLWVALFNGSCIIKIDPRKKETLLDRIELPAKQVTSLAFGGKNLDELYVTTASLPVEGVPLPPPDNGATYRITGLGVKGYPGVKIKL